MPDHNDSDSEGANANKSFKRTPKAGKIDTMQAKLNSMEGDRPLLQLVNPDDSPGQPRDPLTFRDITIANTHQRVYVTPGWFDAKIIRWIATFNCLLKSGDMAGGFSRTTASTYFEALYRRLGLPHLPVHSERTVQHDFVDLLKHDIIRRTIATIDKKLKSHEYYRIDPQTSRRVWVPGAREKLQGNVDGTIPLLSTWFEPGPDEAPSVPGSSIKVEKWDDGFEPTCERSMTSFEELQISPAPSQLPHQPFSSNVGVFDGRLILDHLESTLMHNNDFKKELPAFASGLIKVLYENWSNDLSAIAGLFDTAIEGFREAHEGRIQEKMSRLHDELQTLRQPSGSMLSKTEMLDEELASGEIMSSNPGTKRHVDQCDEQPSTSKRQRQD